MTEAKADARLAKVLPVADPGVTGQDLSAEAEMPFETVQRGDLAQPI
jgi:hypothetical protein